MSEVEEIDSEYVGYVSDALPTDPIEDQSVTLIESVTQSIFNIIDWVYPINPVTGSRNLWYIPKSIENFMGKTMYASMCYTQGGSINHFYSRRVQQIAANLAQHTKRDLPYEVTVLNNNVVNAWCLPGGKVAVYRGILEKIDFYVNHRRELGLHGYTDPSTGNFVRYSNIRVDDVIAALLGHEMTHADARHCARSLELSFFVQASVWILDLLTGQQLNSWEADLRARRMKGDHDFEKLADERSKLNLWRSIHSIFFAWVTPLATQLYFLMGSRSHELEADKYGTQLAIRAGYNPAGALFLQEILKQESGSLYDFMPKLFRDIHKLFHSHPPCDIRQQEIYPVVRDWRQINYTTYS